jgi:hypothetical protein
MIGVAGTSPAMTAAFVAMVTANQLSEIIEYSHRRLIVENIGRRFVGRADTNLYPIIISAEAANIMFTVVWRGGR